MKKYGVIMAGGGGTRFPAEKPEAAIKSDRERFDGQ